MNLGQTIKSIRKQRDYTQEELATACMITQTYLSQIENNLKDPNLSVLKTIAEKLSLPLPILFFLSLNEEDVEPSKIEIFRQLDPLVKQVIDELFQIQE